jgi:tetratricopeptide (TPR) repeat protein
LEEAVEAFTAALRLDPSLATTHHFRAVILDDLGQVANAMEGYQAAVALNPDLVAAQIRLGEIYLGRRLRAESAAAFRAAAAAAKGTAWARIAEARALEASCAVDDALVAIRAGAEAHPQSAEAHLLLGKLLGEVGLFAEAAAHYERATELSPDKSLGWLGLATNRKFTADDRPLIARMNAVLRGSKLTPHYRLSLHFALGKAHDDMGNNKEVMQNFEAGNRYRALGGRLGRQALTRYIDRLIEATQPGYCDRQPDPKVEDATPILIVGLPRSGSTLTEQILSSHPEIAAGGEQGFWGARCAAHGDIRGLTPEATRRLADDYLAALRPLGRGAKRVTDRMLSNFMLLGVIHRVFPNATIIHCRRHPIDTALSIFTTYFEESPDYASDRGDIVFFTRQHQRLMAHWRQVLPPHRFVEVDYEALVADPKLQARRLISACGLEWNDACLAPHQNRRRIETASLWQARQPIYGTSVERWRRCEPWLGELRELAMEA